MLSFVCLYSTALISLLREVELSVELGISKPGATFTVSEQEVYKLLPIIPIHPLQHNQPKIYNPVVRQNTKEFPYTFPFCLQSCRNLSLFFCSAIPNTENISTTKRSLAAEQFNGLRYLTVQSEFTFKKHIRILYK